MSVDSIFGLNGRHSNRPRLFEEGNVRGDAALIVHEPLTEVRSQQIVLNAHADLRADDKEQKGGQQQPPRRNQKPRAEQVASQARINCIAAKALKSLSYSPRT